MKRRSSPPVVVALLTIAACSKSPIAERRPESKPAVAATATPNGPEWARDAAIDTRVESLLAKMTLDEKIGQLNQFSHGHATGPETGAKPYEELIAQGRVGSILNAAGAKDTNALQRIAMERSRLKIPLLFGVDVIHGWRTTFPIPLALAASWDADLVQRTSRVAAQEAAADGIRWTFSPMVDIARDPRWGRIIEGAGEDPFLGSVLAAAYVRGYQGRNLTDPTSIAACMKHWVGYGAAEAGRDYNTTYIPPRLLREIYLPPFKAGVDAGALTLMSAFNSLNDVPSSANPKTMSILKKEWGFKGFVVSDWTSIKEIIAHGIATDGKMAARKSLLGGVDMDMESVLYLTELPALVEEGKVPVSVIDDSVRRILRVKFALGLFERPYAEEKPLPALDRALAKQAAEETFVLLKNGAPKAAPVLPIGAGVRRIAVLGPLADDKNNMHGGWAGHSDENNVVTLRAALAAYANDHKIDIRYERGTEIMGTSDKDFAKAVAAAKHADLVLLAVGEQGDLTGEASSRTQLDLPGNQGRLASAVLATGKPVVLIVFGRPMVLTPYVAKAAAVIQAWHPGIEAGPALVDVLTGAANFSGRLPVTLPRSLGQVPLYYNSLNTGRPAHGVDLSKLGTATDDKYVSRYIDEDNAPLYPFGYGLSYTQFAYSPATASASSLSAKALEHGEGAITVKATVKNTGEKPGVEIVQLYTRLRGTSVALPVRQLKGYQRITLAPGEAREVEFTIDREQLAFWNDDLEHVVEPSALTLWIAPDASSGTPLDLTITE
jgi:beta-glucosidase